MMTTSSRDLAERLAGLERTVERLTSHYRQLQRQFQRSSQTSHTKRDGGLSLWKRMMFRRANGTFRPAIRENKRIQPHVVH